MKRYGPDFAQPHVLPDHARDIDRALDLFREIHGDP